MRLLVLGINHRTAPVEIRGQVAFPVEQLPRALGELTALQNVREAAILSTCNRTELYCAKQDEGQEELTDWLCRFHGLEKGALEPHLYAYWEADAVRHILRVAAGLDSMILGEPQILGQMKDTYQLATEAGSAGYPGKPPVPAHLLGRQADPHRHRDRREPGLRCLRGGQPGTANFRVVRETDGAADRRRRNHRTGRPPPA